MKKLYTTFRYYNTIPIVKYHNLPKQRLKKTSTANLTLPNQSPSRPRTEKQVTANLGSRPYSSGRTEISKALPLPVSHKSLPEANVMREAKHSWGKPGPQLCFWNTSDLTPDRIYLSEHPFLAKLHITGTFSRSFSATRHRVDPKAPLQDGQVLSLSWQGWQRMWPRSHW